jgi:hypothetical protein
MRRVVGFNYISFSNFLSLKETIVSTRYTFSHGGSDRFLNLKYILLGGHSK